MEPVVLLDAAGRRRSAATMPGHRRGQPPRNKGMHYPADPPTVEEIVLVIVLRCCALLPRSLAWCACRTCANAGSPICWRALAGLPIVTSQ